MHQFSHIFLFHRWRTMVFVSWSDTLAENFFIESEILFCKDGRFAVYICFFRQLFHRRLSRKSCWHNLNLHNTSFFRQFSLLCSSSNSCFWHQRWPSKIETLCLYFLDETFFPLLIHDLVELDRFAIAKLRFRHGHLELFEQFGWVPALELGQNLWITLLVFLRFALFLLIDNIWPENGEDLTRRHQRLLGWYYGQVAHIFYQTLG